MLAGLIFATEEAEDRPGTLAATLPFGGMTLLEYQVRLLIGAGAGQILVGVEKVTPALLGAVNRAGRRGVPIDVVRNAEEALQQVHPQAMLLVLADGLVTADPVIDRLAKESGTAMLVTRDPNAPCAVERIDPQHCWAGIARLHSSNLAEIARMPRDYDFQSMLVRVAAQSSPDLLLLGQSWEKGGHAVELSAAALANRSNAVLAALTERRTSWADRWIFTPIARLALPRLLDRGVHGWMLAGGGVLFAMLSFAASWFRMLGVGAGLSLIAVALFVTAAAMAALRGEDRMRKAMEILIATTMAVLLLLAGWAERRSTGLDTPMVLALVAVVAAAIAERVPGRAKRWWGSPSGYLLLFAPCAILGFFTVGLAAVATYAFATLAAAVEGTREKA